MAVGTSSLVAGCGARVDDGTRTPTATETPTDTATATATDTATAASTETPEPTETELAEAPVESRPVLFATEELLETARQRVQDGRDPWLTAFQQTEQRANRGLDNTFEPYQKAEYLTYYRTARRHALSAIEMGMTYAITREQRYADRAGDILLAWAKDAVQDGNDDPARDTPTGQGLVIGRAMTQFSYAYTLVWETLPAEDRVLIENWMRLMVPHPKAAIFYWHQNDYFSKQYFNNHLGAHVMGLTSMGFVLDDDAIIEFALTSDDNPRNFEVLFEGAILMRGDEPWHNDPSISDRHLEGDFPMPQDGEIFDRYRIIGKNGLVYSMLHLRFLTLTAEAALNNGYGRNRYTDTLGLDERLERAYEFYADFFITGSTAARTGYYTRDGEVPSKTRVLYEIAHRRYPDNEKIKAVLEQTSSRYYFDLETFGWTLPLTHGMPGIERVVTEDPDAKREWEFNTDGDLEGWSVRTDASGEVSDGALHLTIEGPKPGIVSPEALNLDAGRYTTFAFRMQNNTPGTRAALYFRRKEGERWGGNQLVVFDVEPNTDGFVEYTISMEEQTAWVGQIVRLRFDPALEPETGTVDIDWIRLTEG